MLSYEDSGSQYKIGNGRKTWNSLYCK